MILAIKHNFFKLAQAVLALLEMAPDDRSRLGFNGQHYAQQAFGRSQLMDRMEALLAEAVAIKKAKAERRR